MSRSYTRRGCDITIGNCFGKCLKWRCCVVAGILWDRQAVSARRDTWELEVKQVRLLSHCTDVKELLEFILEIFTRIVSVMQWAPLYAQLISNKHRERHTHTIASLYATCRDLTLFLLYTWYPCHIVASYCFSVVGNVEAFCYRKTCATAYGLWLAHQVTCRRVWHEHSKRVLRYGDKTPLISA